MAELQDSGFDLHSLAFKPDGAVLDTFGGSGSTLIACEQTGRRCLTMEIDPLYCDVIVKGGLFSFKGRQCRRVEELRPSSGLNETQHTANGAHLAAADLPDKMTGFSLFFIVFQCGFGESFCRPPVDVRLQNFAARRKQGGFTPVCRC